MEIVEFVKAQLAHDKAEAEAARDAHMGYYAVEGDAEWRVSDYGEGVYTEPHGIVVVIGAHGFLKDSTAHHIARHDPARVLADVEAKRYLLEWCTEVAAHFDWSTLNLPGSLRDDPNARATHTAVVALKSLAAPYAGRPGFKPEWRLP